MALRVLFFVYASLAGMLPGTVWAGTGGPVEVATLGLVVVAVLMLAALLKCCYDNKKR